MSFGDDYCYGSGIIYWSDDSYDCGTDCSAPNCPAKKKKVPMTDPTNHLMAVRASRMRAPDRGHHESDREAADRRASMTPSNPSVPSVTVSIPVIVGGYTGQRDAWEQVTHDCAVTLDGSKVVLASTGTHCTKITLDRHGLEAAIAVLGTLG